MPSESQTTLETHGKFACIWFACTCSYIAVVDAGQWRASCHGHFIALVRGWVEKALSFEVTENQQIFASRRIEQHYLELSVLSLVTLLP